MISPVKLKHWRTSKDKMPLALRASQKYVKTLRKVSHVLGESWEKDIPRDSNKLFLEFDREKLALVVSLG